MLKTEYRPVGGPVMAEAIVPATAACAPLAGDWRRTQLPLLTGLPLLPIGTSNGKAPVDPATGAGLRSWQTAAWDPATIAATDPALVTAVGLRCGPDAGGLLAFDVDGESALRALEAAGCEPYKGGWVLSRPSATDRLKVVWRVPPDLWPSAGDRRAGKVVLSTGEGEQLEAFFGSGQIVVAGLHRQSGDLIDWHETGPDQVRDLPPAWHALWQRMGECAPETTGARKARAETCRGEWRTPSICPICGRNDPGDCQQSRDGAAVLCHHGKRWQPPAGLRMGETVERSGSRWAFCGDYANAIGSAALFRVHRPRSLQQEAPQAAPAVDQASTPTKGAQRRLTAQEKLSAMRQLAAELLANSTPYGDRVPLLRAHAEALEITLSSAELRSLIWDARRAASGSIEALGPGDQIDLTPAPWAWEGVVMLAALNLLVALPKVGKTSLILAMLAAWHRGEASFLGQALTGTCPPVLIVGTDQPQSDWGRMLLEVGLIGADGVIREPIVGLFHSGRPLHLDQEGIERIATYAASHPGLFVMVDSIAAVTGSLGIDENSAEIAEPIRDLMEAVEPFGATVVALHHANKAQQSGATLASRGSTALPATASQVIHLSPMAAPHPGAPPDKRVTLKTNGRAGQPQHLLIERTESGWVSHGSAESVALARHLLEVESKINDRQADALELVRDQWANGKRMEAKGLAAAMDLGKHGSDVALRTLKQLVRKGLLQSVMEVGIHGRTWWFWPVGSDTPKGVPTPSRGVLSEASEVSEVSEVLLDQRNHSRTWGEGSDTSDTNDTPQNTPREGCRKVSEGPQAAPESPADPPHPRPSAPPASAPPAMPAPITVGSTVAKWSKAERRHLPGWVVLAIDGDTATIHRPGLPGRCTCPLDQLVVTGAT